MGTNELSGSVTTANLPSNLRDLTLVSNQLSGSFYFAAVPTGLEALFLVSNEFTGLLNFEALLMTLHQHVLLREYLPDTADAQSLGIDALPQQPRGHHRHNTIVVSREPLAGQEQVFRGIRCIIAPVVT